MKRIFAAVLSVSVVLAAAGCNSGENSVNGSLYTDGDSSDISSRQTTVEPESTYSSFGGSSSSVSEKSSSSESSTTTSISTGSKSETGSSADSSSSEASTVSSDTTSSQSESSDSADPGSSSSEPPQESSSDSESQPALEVHIHQYEEQKFEPTCEESGYIVYNCSCGESYKEIYAEALGHSFTQAVTEPTCTSGGFTRYTCQRCNFQYTADEVAAKGHNWGEWEISVEPTTSSEGDEISVCSNCGETQHRSIPKIEDLSVYVSEVVRIVNEERSKAGLSPLAENGELNEYAQLRSTELVNNFAHERPDGSSPLDHVMGMSGIYTAGENIAMGYTSPEAVMNGWMNSTGHRENILRSGFTMIGVGCYKYNGSLYWTQIFAG